MDAGGSAGGCVRSGLQVNGEGEEHECVSAYCTSSCDYLQW